MESIAVNVSARQLVSKDFTKIVESALQETGMPAHCLELEITESAFINDTSALTKELDQLHELGVTISIDDFGKEYSSLNYLKKIPFDLIKIDREFIMDLDKDQRDQHIVKVIILFHSDGEFSSLQELIIATLTQRNLGWLPNEERLASEHICSIVKYDDGKGSLASSFGGFSYKEILSGISNKDDALPVEYLIGKTYRIDVLESLCDETILAIARLLGAYISDLQFSKNSLALSPYNTFLTINKLPLIPNENESNHEYSARL